MMWNVMMALVHCTYAESVNWLVLENEMGVIIEQMYYQDVLVDLDNQSPFTLRFQSWNPITQERVIAFLNERYDVDFEKSDRNSLTFVDDVVDEIHLDLEAPKPGE